MRTKHAPFVGMLFAGILMGNTALAAPITGTINAGSGGGLFATGSWATEEPYAELSWEVSESSNIWTYEYTFSLPAKENSHSIFEVSSDFAAENILDGTTSGWELGNWYDQGMSNPGIPGTLYGIKFDGSGLNDMFTIVTDRAPMWGSFYSKDGREGGGPGSEWVYAHNENFGSYSNAGIYGDAPSGYALVPNTETAKVSEPGTLGMMGLGFLSLVLGSVFTRRKTDALG